MQANDIPLADPPAPVAALLHEPDSLLQDILTALVPTEFSLEGWLDRLQEVTR